MSTFKLIQPFQTCDVSLVSSTVSATDPDAVDGVYNPATAYVEGAVVQVDSPTFTFTASGYVFIAAAHGFTDGTMLKTSSSGTLPPGLVANTRYYMVQARTNTYKLSLRKGGTPIATTGAGAGTHTATVSSHKVYEALQATTGNTPHKSPLYWQLIGETNRWKCLDLSRASQTINAESATYVLQTEGVIDGVYLGNIEAQNVTITARESGGGAIVYGPTTYNLVRLVETPFDFFFSTVEYVEEFTDIDLPAYSDLQITIALTRTGGVVKIGTLLVGLSKNLGVSMMGATFSDRDYSVKTTDEWGNATFVERPYSKLGTFSIMVNAADVDSVKQALSKYRATPIVYVGTTAYDSAIFFGKYNRFSLLVDYENYSVADIEVESLT